MSEALPMSEDIPRAAVAAVGCDRYEANLVFEAVGRGLSLLGGAASFVRPGETVLLKPNLLAGAAPSKVVTTHPDVFSAVARHFQAAGAQLRYGDSPGVGRPEHAARLSKVAEAAERLGVATADFSTGVPVSFPGGQLIKQFTLAAGALDVDGIVSLPKLKSHGLTRMTGAVKNQFGCVPGLLKGEFHARLPELSSFAQMLVDLTRLLAPRLYVMDAIEAMEGNGPRSGSPRALKVLLFSRDPVALDTAACSLMGLDPLLVTTIEWGERMGLGSTQVQWLGDAPDPFRAPDFRINRDKKPIIGSMPGWPAGLLRRYVASRPAIAPERCTRCGTCVRACPLQPKAVDFHKGADKPPVYDYNACIRCFCCQEMCPDHAIAIHKTPLGRLLRL